MPSPTPQPSPAPEPGAGPSAPWWRRPVTWAVAAVVLVVAVVVAVATTRDDAEPQASATPSATASEDGPAAGPTSEPSEAGEGDGAGSEGAETGDGGDDEADAGGEAGEVVRPTAPPVALDAPAEPAPQVTATLSRIEAVEGEANLPGEVGGPSLRVTVTVANGTDAELDLTTAVVNLYHGADRAPAITLLEPGHEDFPPSVAPGREASGTFVFRVPPDQRGDVLVELDLSTQADVVLFTGAAPA